MTGDEMMSIMAYHAGLRDLIMSMDKPGREMTVGNIGDNEQPQMIFAVGEDGPVTSVTLVPRLLFALANSANLRLLIEDEIIKCEETCEAEGLDIHVPKGVAA